jgi:hypothetical protein
MGVLGETDVSVRFWGDDLDPAALTLALRAQPTLTRTKGDVRRSGSHEIVAKAGQWNLSTGYARPGDLDSQIRGHFAMMTDDLAVWTRLSAQYHGDLFCGLFMQETNDGLSLEVSTIEMIAARGLTVQFDIYAPMPPDA